METLIANDQEKIEVGEALRRMIERVVQAALATAAAYRRERGETLPDWLAAVLASPHGEVSVALVDDPQIHELNREYRNVDCPTDVLSFAGEEAPQTEDEPALLGDVIVSLETAWRQAAEYGHTPEREVGYLVAHGVLHLLGFDHEDEAQREEMRRLEETALAQVDLVREGAPS